MKKINTILVAIDLSMQECPAVPYAFALASQLGAQVILSFVVDKDKHASPSYIDMSRVHNKEDLESEKSGALYALAKLVPPEYANVKHELVPVVDTDIVKGIVQAAENGGADLIVLTAHDRGLLGEMLHGSVSHKLLHAAPCPVLVMKKK